jgi:hypothetical protein
MEPPVEFDFEPVWPRAEAEQTQPRLIPADRLRSRG